MLSSESAPGRASPSKFLLEYDQAQAILRERLDAKDEARDRAPEAGTADHVHIKPHVWDSDDGSSFLRGWEHGDYEDPPFVPLHLVNHIEESKHPGRYAKDRKRQLQKLKCTRRYTPQAGIYFYDANPVSPPEPYSEPDPYDQGASEPSLPKPVSPKSASFTFGEVGILSVTNSALLSPDRDKSKQKASTLLSTRQARPAARPGRPAPLLPLIGSSKGLPPLTPSGGILPNPVRRSRASCVQFYDISADDTTKLPQCLNTRGKGRRYAMMPSPSSRNSIKFGWESKSEGDEVSGQWEEIWHSRRSSPD